MKQIIVVPILNGHVTRTWARVTLDCIHARVGCRRDYAPILNLNIQSSRNRLVPLSIKKKLSVTVIALKHVMSSYLEIGEIDYAAVVISRFLSI